MSGIEILGMGKGIPSRCLTNEDMTAYVETSDEWIRTRTGICTRYFCGEGETHTTLTLHAAKEAMERSGVKPEQIGLVIVATVTADYLSPSAACRVQEALGIPEGTPAFDINAACSGFIYALNIASCMLPTLERQYALLIGVEKLSSILDMQDRSTCVLFGDAAGAAVVRTSPSHRFFVQIGAAGDTDALHVPHINGEYGYLQMDGRKIFRFAVGAIPKVVKVLEEKSGISVQEVDYLVCHQANARILEHVRKKLDLPQEKMYMNLQKYGNTSAASIPVALCEMQEKGLLKKGTRIFAVGFGAGLTWGGVYLEF